MSSKREDFARFQSRATLPIFIILGIVFFVVTQTGPHQFKQSILSRRITSVSDAALTENLDDDKEITSEHGEGEHGIAHVVLFPW